MSYHEDVPPVEFASTSTQLYVGDVSRDIAIAMAVWCQFKEFCYLRAKIREELVGFVTHIHGMQAV